MALFNKHANTQAKTNTKKKSKEKMNKLILTHMASALSCGFAFINT